MKRFASFSPHWLPPLRSRPVRLHRSRSGATVGDRHAPRSAGFSSTAGPDAVPVREGPPRAGSACSAACATYWPPLLARGKPTAGRGVKASLLGTIRRAGGTTQVTYAGHPLYRYLPDTKPGQTNGQDSHDFGAGWYVLSPAGKKIETIEPGNKAQESTKPNLPRYSAR